MPRFCSTLLIKIKLVLYSHVPHPVHSSAARLCQQKGFQFQNQSAGNSEISEEMAMAMVRSGALRTALRGGSRASAPPKRPFASSAHHDDARKSLSLSHAHRLV